MAFLKKNLMKKNLVAHKGLVNLRFKGLVKWKSKKKFIFSSIWGHYFLKKACSIIENVVEKRGIVYVFSFKFLFKNFFYKNVFIMQEKAIPGFLVSPSLKKKNKYPDLVICLSSVHNDLLMKSGFTLNIPVIAPLIFFDDFKSSFPIITDKKNKIKFLFYFYKSILEGKKKEKILFYNVKKKKI